MFCALLRRSTNYVRPVLQNSRRGNEIYKMGVFNCPHFTNRLDPPQKSYPLASRRGHLMMIIFPDTFRTNICFGGEDV